MITFIKLGKNKDNNYNTGNLDYNIRGLLNIDFASAESVEDGLQLNLSVHRYNIEQQFTVQYKFPYLERAESYILYLDHIHTPAIDLRIVAVPIKANPWYLKDMTIETPFCGAVFLGRVFIDSQRNSFIYINCSYYETPEDSETLTNYYLEYGKETEQKYMRRVSEEYQEYYKKKSAKTDFILNVDILDSLSYLEMQNDLLLRIILQSGIEIPESLRSLATSIDQHSILNYNNSEKLQGKVQHKADFRAKQLAYYNKIQEQ